MNENQDRRLYPASRQFDLTPGPVASPALWLCIVAGSLVGMWQLHSGVVGHESLRFAHLTGAVISAIVAFLPAWIMVRYESHPTRLTLAPDALSYAPSLGKLRKVAWADIGEVRASTFRGAATITIRSTRDSSPFCFGWLSAGRPRPREVVAAIEKYSAQIKGEAIVEADQPSPQAVIKRKKSGPDWLFLMPTTGKLIVYIGGPLLVVFVASRPSHDPYSRPEREYAAPWLSVPEGCKMFKTHYGEELTKACDTPESQLALADDFDIHLRSYKTSHIIRLGNYIYAVDCSRVWPGCQIADSQVGFFFQPTAPQLETLRAHRTRFRGAPVELGQGLYGYPDMFPDKP